MALVPDWIVCRHKFTPPLIHSSIDDQVQVEDLAPAAGQSSIAILIVCTVVQERLLPFFLYGTSSIRCNRLTSIVCHGVRECQ